MSEKDEISIDEYTSSIIADKKQVSVRIPKDIVDILEINPEKDIFVWALIKHNEDIMLAGRVKRSSK